MTAPVLQPDQATVNNLPNALAFLEWHPQARLFPCARYEEGQHKALVKWSQASSSDPVQVRAWGQQYPGCYFCADLIRSPYTAIDPDDKTGRDGNATLGALEAQHGSLPGTLGSKTPSGKGRHLLFHCGQKLKTGADRLGIGLDIPVMVPLPGQFVPGKGVYTLTGGPQCAELPGWVVELAGRASDKQAAEDLNVPAPGVVVDNEPRVLDAMLYALREAPGASAGRRDRTTFDVAQGVRDFGLSFETTLRIMRDVWAARTDVEIIDLQNLAEKVRSAYQYSRNRLGETLPEAVFSAIPMAAPGGTGFKLLAIKEVLRTPRGEEWLVKGILPRRGLAQFYGAPKAGKSFVCIDLAARVALGLPWHGHKVRQGPVVYVAGEGHRGLRKRFEAWALFNGHSLENAPIAVSATSVPLDDPLAAQEVTRAIAEASSGWGRGPALVVIDTVARCMAGDENSSRDMSAFVRSVDRCLGDDALRLLVHHVGHGAKDRARGSSSLPAALDACFRLDRGQNGVTLVCDFMKDGASPSPLAWLWREVEIWRGEVGGEDTAITSLALEPVGVERVAPRQGAVNEKQVQVLDLLRALESRQGSVDLKGIQKAAIDQGIYTRSDNVARAVSVLVEKGHVARTGEVLTCLQ